jgi:hypothetical protein
MNNFYHSPYFQNFVEECKIDVAQFVNLYKVIYDANESVMPRIVVSSAYNSEALDEGLYSSFDERFSNWVLPPAYYADMKNKYAFIDRIHIFINSEEDLIKDLKKMEKLLVLL